MSSKPPLLSRPAFWTPLPPAPAKGTGILTIDGIEYPFAVAICTTEPAPSGVGTAIILLELRRSMIAEGQPVEARALRIDSGGLVGDSYDFGYATDPNDFESLVSVGSEFGIGLTLSVTETVDGTVIYGPPTPFERTEGNSVVDDVNPGDGSIIATC